MISHDLVVFPFYERLASHNFSELNIYINAPNYVRLA